MTLTDASMNVIQEALATLKYLQLRRATWDKEEGEKLVAIYAAIAELEALRAKPDAQADVWEPVSNGAYHTQGPEVIDIADETLRIAPVDAQPIPVEALEYVVTHYLLSSTSAPLGERAVYSQQMFLLQEWLENKPVEVQPVPVESLRRLLALCRSRYETTGRLGYELVEVEKWLAQRPTAEAGT